MRGNRNEECGSRDGLSPRVRGNRHQSAGAESSGYQTACNPVRVGGGVGGGSIPACAGEPVSIYPSRPLLGLSPRGGGTLRWAALCWASVYPRVCGGTLARSGLSPRVRTNNSAATTRPENRVYPRVCGGTEVRIGCEKTDPRAGEPWPPVSSWRSIPACAGNQSKDNHNRNRGSIPACAGEPEQSAATLISIRSIPACAGEPILCPL